MKRIAVYGSLRRGEQANRALRDCKFLNEVRVPGFDLFALTWFPGIRENPKNKEGVVVELFELPENNEGLIQHLDHYEGFNRRDPERSLFVRKEIEVNGEPTLIYVFNKNPYDAFGTSARVVPGGDWVQYKGEMHHAA